MKTLLAKIGLLSVFGLFAASCATSPKEYHVELADKPDEVAEEKSAMEQTYEDFPYMDFRGSSRF